MAPRMPESALGPLSNIGDALQSVSRVIAQLACLGDQRSGSLEACREIGALTSLIHPIAIRK